MKRLAGIVILCSLMVTTFAQRGANDYDDYGRREVRTLFGQGAGNGGYGAISLGFTEVNNRNGLTMGGRGMWIIGHGLGLGVGGYGLVSEPEYVPADGVYNTLTGGYGGFMIEPIIMGRWPIHISLPVMIGAGGIAQTYYTDDFNLTGDPYNTYFQDANAFFVLEPGVELEFNLVRFIRFSLFGTYRYTTDILIQDVNAGALKGWSAGVTLKIGSF